MNGEESNVGNEVAAERNRHISHVWEPQVEYVAPYIARMWDSIKLSTLEAASSGYLGVSDQPMRVECLTESATKSDNLSFDFDGFRVFRM